MGGENVRMEAKSEEMEKVLGFWISRFSEWRGAE